MLNYQKPIIVVQNVESGQPNPILNSTCQVMAAGSGMYAKNLMRVKQSGKQASNFLMGLKYTQVSQYGAKKQQSFFKPPLSRFAPLGINGIIKSTIILPSTPEQKLHCVLFAQRMFRGFKARKVYKQMRKQHRYRKNVILEIIQTEEAYVGDLDKIINSILLPLHDEQVITEGQTKILSSNIRDLKLLNGQFFKDLTERFPLFYVGPYEKVGDLLYKYAPFFKMYFQYYSDYHKMDLIIKMLKKDNAKFNAFDKKMNISIEFRYLDIESYLVKPVQRLPKYVLLLRDLLKHTDVDHPDHANLLKSEELYSQVTDNNDLKLGQVNRNSKLFELQKQFPYVKILDANRNFLSQEVLQIFKKDKLKPVVVYVMSDMIIVLKKKLSQKLVAAIYLNKQSVVKDLPDTQYYSNMLTIIGDNDSVTFVEQTYELKQRRMFYFDEVIQGLKNLSDQRKEAYSKNNQMKFDKNYLVEVSVIGTEQRRTITYNYQTYYVIDVTIQNIAQKIYLRHSELRGIQEKVQKLFPKLHITYLKQHLWGASGLAKEIESRTISITQFISTLMSSQEFRNSPTNKSILVEMGLPENFYNLPNLLSQQLMNLDSLREYRSTPSDNYQKGASMSNLNQPNSCARSSRDLQFGESRKSMSSPSQKISATKLIRQTNESKPKSNQASILVSVVSFHPNKPTLSYMIKADTRTADLYQYVMLELGLKEIFDFKFLVKDKAKPFRPLSDDELLFPMFNTTSILSMLMNDKKEIYFRKYFHLDPVQEELQFNQDLIKLDMVYSQFISELSNYYLTFKEYCMLAAIDFYVNGISFMKNTKLSYERLAHIIPTNILKNTRKEIWIKAIPDSCTMLNETIMLKAQESDQDQGNNNESVAKMLFISTIYNNDLSGKELFLIQPTKETQVFLSTKDGNIYIGIGIYGLTFHDSKKKHQLKELLYSNLQNMRAFAGSLQIYDVLDTCYIFNCSNGFQIQQLVDEYLQIIFQMSEEDQM